MAASPAGVSVHTRQEAAMTSTSDRYSAAATSDEEEVKKSFPAVVPDVAGAT